VRPRLGARAAYALWIAPPLAALAVLIPHRGPAEVAVAPFVAQAGQAAARALPSAPAQDLLALALLGLWICGALATALLLAQRQLAFMRSLGPLTPAPHDRRLVHATRTGVGPALVGALRPRIVAPADFEARYDAAERALILAHERTHLAAGDGLVNATACAAQCLGWFNPLVHLAVRLLRIDQELACDAEVIGRFPEARHLYGELLLKTQLAHDALPLGCHWPAKGAHPLKERIAMLKSPLPALAERRAGLAVAALVGLAAAGWSWAASATAPDLAGPPVFITQPVWLKKPTAADFERVYPAGGPANHAAISASIICGIAADGTLKDCDGFNWASKSDHWNTPRDPQSVKTAMREMAKLFQMAPMSRDGVPTAGRKVEIPMIWLPPGEKR
jgi:beta-lactamase regulating signal transducer with metallopeptidase domain